MRLAQRTFTFADQQRFASVSGDHNPIHTDALRARRTQAGAPVVHGIHLLLWAVDSLAAARPNLPQVCGIRAQFSNFIYLDEPAEVILTHLGPNGARLSISANGFPRSKVFLDFVGSVQNQPDWSTSALEQAPLAPEPVSLDFEQISGRSGRIPFAMTPGNAAMLFPAATNLVGVRRIAALAASTYLVGMICPGLHSIYSEVSLRTYTESDLGEFLAFRVIETDRRFHAVEEEIAGGGVTGTVKSFFRTPPVQQTTIDLLAEIVHPTEFAGSAVLIVGGSRGLGELTAKLIAAGGGRVRITWHTGSKDAEGVAEEIRSSGGKCETLRYDALKPADQQLVTLAEAPTHAYYFATPPIFRPQAEIFLADRLKQFTSVYVDGFWDLARTLRARQPRLSMFYPSSVSVDHRPRGMTEYTMAKAAGEVLCADMNEYLAPMRITVTRLPRMLTDQTTSITETDSADPLKTMLPIVRLVQSRPT